MVKTSQQSSFQDLKLNYPPLKQEVTQSAQSMNRTTSKLVQVIPSPQMRPVLATSQFLNHCTPPQFGTQRLPTNLCTISSVQQFPPPLAFRWKLHDQVVTSFG